MDSLPTWVRWITVVAIGLSPILTVFGVCILGRRFPRRPPQFGSSAVPDQFREILPRGAVIDRGVDPALSEHDLGWWR